MDPRMIHWNRWICGILESINLYYLWTVNMKKPKRVCGNNCQVWSRAPGKNKKKKNIYIFITWFLYFFFYLCVSDISVHVFNIGNVYLNISMVVIWAQSCMPWNISNFFCFILDCNYVMSICSSLYYETGSSLSI